HRKLSATPRTRSARRSFCQLAGGHVAVAVGAHTATNPSCARLHPGSVCLPVESSVLVVEQRSERGRRARRLPDTLPSLGEARRPDGRASRQTTRLLRVARRLRHPAVRTALRIEGSPWKQSPTLTSKMQTPRRVCTRLATSRPMTRPRCQI